MACDVVVLVGSLRKESITRKLACALVEAAPPELRCEQVEIRGLPLYNADLETETPPAPWQGFRDRIRRADAILFATPEYNRSIPGALKNAIDVGSRPKPANVWANKPALVMSMSTGMLGGFGANHHLRQALVAVAVPVMPSPEVYISNAKTLLDEEGRLARDDTRDFFRTVMQRFAAWIAALSAKDGLHPR